MDEFAGGGHFRVVPERLAQPVLDRLHVVVGGRLDGLHALGVARPRNPGRRGRAPSAVAGGEGGQQRRSAGSAASAFSHAISTRTRRRISANSLKWSCKRAGLGGVAPVERRKGGEGVGHGGTVGDIITRPGAAGRAITRCYTRRPSSPVSPCE